MRPLHLLGSAGFAVMLAASTPSAAETASRQVIVNGALMNSAELLVLDIANCGSKVPDGRYWLNINTGAWGYEGGRQQGVIGSQCKSAPAVAQNPQSECDAKYRYSEDRMCYCHNMCVDLGGVTYP